MCEAQDVCEKERQTRALNNEELMFLADWAMMCVKFSLAEITPCSLIWNDCLLSKDGEILLKRISDNGFDKIKLDKSDGDIVISIARGGSFNFYGILVE